MARGGIARKRFSETAIKGGRKRAWIAVATISIIALSVIALLLLIAGYPNLHAPLPSAASPSSAASPLATATVQRVAHGKLMRYSINVPDGWSVEQEQKYDYDLMMSAQKQTLCVGVIAEEVDYGSLDALVANAKDFVRKQAGGAVTFSDVAPITIDNRTWRTFRLQVRLPNGIPTTQELCVYTGSEGTFQVVGWTITNQFDRDAPKLREVIHSFKFPNEGPR